MEIIDTYDEIKNCISSGKFNIKKWEIYADKISPDFKEKMKKDSENYDFTNEILPVINYLIENQSKLDHAHSSFVNLTKSLSEKVENTLKIKLNITIIFCLGLCNGAGWATTLSGKDTILLGVEKIVELSWHNEKDFAGLLYHEIGYICHKKMRKDKTAPMKMKEKSLWTIFSEGMAMYIEQIIYGDMNFYHQDKNGWLDWCKRNEKKLFIEYLRRVKCGEKVDQFFGDWQKFEGVSDVGYFLGCELMKYLSRYHDLVDVANLKLEDIENAMNDLIMNI